MKKTKWLKSLGVVAALTMPLATALTTITGCSKKSYTELVSELKDATITKFIELSQQVHRSVWNEGEAYKYIKKQMQSMGFTDPSGYDRWSEVKTVALERESELEQLKLKGETDGGEYGNLWYDIPATPGYEDVPKIIIHTHMDSQMEFADDDAHKTWAKDYESGGGVDVNFDRDNEIIQSNNNKTSLGSDGGIGIAALLTLVKYRNNFNHGGLRLIFAAGESEAIAKRSIYDPISEETIIYDEYAAGFSFLEVDQKNNGVPTGETESYLGNNSTKPFGEPGEFKHMISIAGILKNSITVSSAGIHECNFSTPDEYYLNNNAPGEDESASVYWTANKIDWNERGYTPVYPQSVSKKLITVKISGLEGGTSSAYINKGLANALTLLFRIAYTGDTKMQIISINSNPSSAYSICTDATMQYATFYDKDLIQMKFYSFKNYFQSIFPNEDWSKVTIDITQASDDQKSTFPKYGLSKQQSRALLRMVANDLTFGPIGWFDNEQKEVQTSENYGPLILDIKEETATATSGPKTSLVFHVVERSSDTAQLQIFYNLTHSILEEGLGPMFTDYWTIEVEDCTQHISDPVWEKQENNKMADAFEKAYANFSISPTLNNEHAWVEIACIPEIYENCNLGEFNIALLGPQINYNHTINETMYTDTLTSMLSTVVYVLDNSRSLLA